MRAFRDDVKFSEISGGDYEGTSTSLKSMIARMIVTKENGCWEWSGPTLPNGYPYLRYQGHNVPASSVVRMSCDVVVRARAMLIRTCGNQACVSPNHVLYTDEAVLSGLSEKDNGCLEFSGPLVDGYGKAFINGKHVRVHRWMLERELGHKIPKGQLALHKCNNRACCRIHKDHVYLSDHKQNMTDMVESGRQARGETHGLVMHPEKAARGESHGSKTHPEKIEKGSARYNAVFNEDLVVNIRERFASGETQTHIAQSLSANQGDISNICLGKTWRHAGGPVAAKKSRKKDLQSMS